MVSGGRSRKRCHPRNSAAALASVAGCGAHRLQRPPASRDSPAKQKLWISTAMQKKKPPGEPGGKFNREALQGTDKHPIDGREDPGGLTEPSVDKIRRKPLING